MEYALSLIDQERFGVVTAKVLIDNEFNIPELIERSRVDIVEFLIARVPTEKIKVVQRLEQEGFFLTDTLVYFVKRKLQDTLVTLPEGYTFRLAVPEDANSVEDLALATFQNYQGHYHADPKLITKDCDLVYSSWAGNSCRDARVADVVILIEKGKEIAAFATIKSNSVSEMEGVLFGISPSHRNKNLYQSLMCLSLNWAVDNSYRQMTVSTQVTNIVVQKYWCRLGFEPANSYYTFHKWFK